MHPRQENSRLNSIEPVYGDNLDKVIEIPNFANYNGHTGFIGHIGLFQKWIIAENGCNITNYTYEG